MKCNLYAVVEKDSNRAISLIESGLVEWYEKNMPGFDILPVGNTGRGQMRCVKGIIDYFSIFTNDPMSESHIIVTDWPDKLSLGECYEILKK